MDRLREHDMQVDPAKARLFIQEVEYCGHLLRDGQRRTATCKLLAIQKWTCPQVVSHLRGFLGSTNYYSGYVAQYAAFAAPLTSKMSVIHEDGKMGSQKRLVWKKGEIRAFEELKAGLLGELVLFQADQDKQFVLRCDASDRAIGAVLEQNVKARRRLTARCR
jgi:hypothetical protein